MNDTRRMFAEYVARQAAWRAEKAEEYPDDERHRRSADALATLADLVMGDDELGAEVDKLAEVASFETFGAYLPCEEATRLISTYGFHPNRLVQPEHRWTTSPVGLLHQLVELAQKDMIRFRREAVSSERMALAEYVAREAERRLGHIARGCTDDRLRKSVDMLETLQRNIEDDESLVEPIERLHDTRCLHHDDFFPSPDMVREFVLFGLLDPVPDHVTFLGTLVEIAEREHEAKEVAWRRQREQDGEDVAELRERAEELQGAAWEYLELLDDSEARPAAGEIAEMTAELERALEELRFP